MRIRWAAFVVCLGTLLVSHAVGAAPARKGLLDRQAVMRAAREVTRERYPNADDVLVDDYILTRYNADGTSVTRDDTFMKVLTEKGRRENETLSFHFSLPYSRVRVELVEVIKPDGRVIAVDVARQSRVMVDPSQMGSNIYNPNHKILRVGVPGVEVGDLVRYYFVRETVKARVPGTWSDYHVLEYTSPIRRYVLEIIGPEALPLRRIALKDEIKGTVAFRRWKEGDRLHYKWVATNVPRMYKEPSMPALHTVVQRLLVSTIADWKTISRWYWRLCEPHLKTTPAIRRKVADLTRGIADRRKRVEAVFKFVSQKIRYMGITTEKTAPGYEPHDVRITFEKKYGVCRDKAALLVAMLREAGFQAYPVLIHNGPKKDPDVPQPYFNHAVSAVANPDGSYLLMDATDENTKQLFPAYLGNQSYLIARPEGETLLTSPAPSYRENLMRIETRARLNARGDLTAECVLRFEGINDNAYRGYFSRLKPEERRRFFETRAKRVVAGARLTDFRLEPEDTLDTSKPLKVTLGLEAKDVLVADEKTALLPLPQWGARMGIVNFILGKTGLKKRKYPLKTDIACGVEETLELDLDAALGPPLALPEFTPIEDEAVTWTQTLEHRNGRLRTRGAFYIKVVEFSPAQYLDLKKALEEIEFNRRKTPVFARRAAAAETGYGPDVDAVVLDAEVTYQLKDAHTWTETRRVKKKILTYAGKKANSELKLAYNPAWEELTLEMATVTGRDGTRKTLRREERNLMDAPWVGAAPRYPAGKVLVASLPGVDVGSVIEYRVKRVRRNRPFFSAVEYFRGFDPIQRKRVSIEAPPGVKLRRAHRLPPGAAIGDAGTGAEVRDQPAVRREANLPPLWAFAPHFFASAGDWKTYARAVGDVLRRAAAGQPRATAKARELTRGVAHDRGKVVAVRDFVARNIRAAGPGLPELPLSAITPADRTLADGYGNIADRAVLLYAMLNAAGFEPRFILASAQRRIEGVPNPAIECPDPSLFDQVLVRVTLGGKEVYLNDTDQYAALGATPHDGCLALALDTGRIGTIAAAPDRRDHSEIAYILRLQPDGEATITRRRTFHGTAFGTVHKQFAEMRPEERRRYHLEVIATLSDAAEPVGDLVTRFDTYPGYEEFTVRIERFAVRDGRYLYLRLPAGLAGLPGVRGDRRENPLYWAAPLRAEVTYRLELPRGFATVLRPPHHAWRPAGGRGRVRLESETAPGAANRLTLRQRMDLPSVVLPGGEYAALLEIHRHLGHPRSRTLLLRKGP